MDKLDITNSVMQSNEHEVRIPSEQDLLLLLSKHREELIDRGFVGNVNQIQTEILRYVVGKRFTARCKAAIGGKNGFEKEFTFIIKSLKNITKARNLYENLIALQNEEVGRFKNQNGENVKFRFPKALAFDKEKSILFMEDLPGQNLAEVLSEIELKTVIHEVGHFLSEFHCANVRSTKNVTIENEIVEVRKANEIIGSALPNFRAPLHQILQKLIALQVDDPFPSKLLHGSFRINHILISKNELTLLDFESLRNGHPAYDLANFLSSLYYMEAQKRISTKQRYDIARYFLEGYAAKPQWTIQSVTVLWFLVSLLINKQTKKYVTHKHPDQQVKVKQMLTLAERILSKGKQLKNDHGINLLWKILP